MFEHHEPDIMIVDLRDYSEAVYNRLKSKKLQSF